MLPKIEALCERCLVAPAQFSIFFSSGPKLRWLMQRFSLTFLSPSIPNKINTNYLKEITTDKKTMNYFAAHHAE